MKRTTATLLTWALAAGGGLALTVAVPGVASASSCGTTTVTNEALNGWQIPYAPNNPNGTTAGSNVTFNEAGGIDLSIAPDGRAIARYDISLEGVPLASQTAQSQYAVVGDTGVTGFSYQLVLDLNRASASVPDTTGLSDFTQLVNEPSANTPDDEWYSTRQLQGGPGGQQDTRTLDEISQAYPNATIQAFLVQLGKLGDATQSATANIDSVRFGCNVFEFELANRAPVANIIVDDGSDSDYRTFWVSGTTSTDPDGDALTYAWTVENGTPSTSTASEFLVTFPNGPGTYEVELTVSDGAQTSTRTTEITVAPPTNTVQENELPNTGASVIGLAVLTGAALVGGGAGTVLSRRRRNSTSA